MMEATMDRTLPLKMVVAEQVRVVGLALRREAVLAAVIIGVPSFLLFLLTVFPGASVLVDSAELAGFTLDPSDPWGLLAAALAVLCPMAVWKGEELFGDATLWSLPVEHRRHALIKVGAGWVWLMAFIAAVFAWFALLALLTGGCFGDTETRYLVTDFAAFAAGTASPEPVTWHTAWWQWLLPFTAATAAYLATSALFLATEHPWRWVGGVFVAFIVIGIIGEEERVEWLNNAWERVLWGLLFQPLGLDSLVTGGWEALRTMGALPSGERIPIWRDLPTLGRWASSTALWISLGAASLWAASFRHREH